LPTWGVIRIVVFSQSHVSKSHSWGELANFQVTSLLFGAALTNGDIWNIWLQERTWKERQSIPWQSTAHFSVNVRIEHTTMHSDQCQLHVRSHMHRNSLTIR
jgi:hypothetical protein